MFDHKVYTEINKKCRIFHLVVFCCFKKAALSSSGISISCSSSVPLKGMQTACGSFSSNHALILASHLFFCKIHAKYYWGILWNYCETFYTLYEYYRNLFTFILKLLMKTSLSSRRFYNDPLRSPGYSGSTEREGKKEGKHCSITSPRYLFVKRPSQRSFATFDKDVIHPSSSTTLFILSYIFYDMLFSWLEKLLFQSSWTGLLCLDFMRSTSSRSVLHLHLHTWY